MMIETRIGKSRNDLTGERHLPTGTETVVPRPFDIRHIWRQMTGRDIGGNLTLGDFEGMDWIYGATNAAAVLDIFNSIYDPLYPMVWVLFYDPYSNAAHWYEATMYEPHIERGAGNTATTIIVSFRGMVRYE